MGSPYEPASMGMVHIIWIEPIQQGHGLVEPPFLDQVHCHEQGEANGPKAVT